MKLRNKTTKEVWNIPEWRTPAVQEGDICFFAELNGEGKLFSYKSLDDLNKEWDDYTPAEPLIKDKEIRKAVRAWAEALDLRWFKRCGSVNAHTSRLYGQDAIGTGYTMELGPNDLYGGSISEKGYTIAELCGEEEE